MPDFLLSYDTIVVVYKFLKEKMEKEVTINLKEAAGGGAMILINELALILGAIPMLNEEKTQISFLLLSDLVESEGSAESEELTNDLTDEQINGIITQCIGSIVEKVEIGEVKLV